MTTPCPGHPAEAKPVTTLVGACSAHYLAGHPWAPLGSPGRSIGVLARVSAKTLFRDAGAGVGTSTPALWRCRLEVDAVERDQRYLTQNEAAALCGCDYTTVRRHRERGHFPGARRRDDATRTWEVPVEDLIAAGLWRPAEGDGHDLDAAIGRTKVERRLEEARVELERARVRIEALTAALADRRDEIAYLRKALDTALFASKVVA